jgi:hypothetical protein
MLGICVLFFVILVLKLANLIVGDTWFWIQGVLLAKYVLYHLSHVPAQDLPFFLWKVKI